MFGIGLIQPRELADASFCTWTFNKPLFVLFNTKELAGAQARMDAENKVFNAEARAQAQERDNHAFAVAVSMQQGNVQYPFFLYLWPDLPSQGAERF
jgi:hypothetical protein